MLRWALPILRFLMIGLISLLLLVPMLRFLQGDVQKPILIFGLDESLSVKDALDESGTREDFQNQWSDLGTRLGADYQVFTYKFGDQIEQDPTYEFADKLSDVSEFISFVSDNYAHQNLGAVVLATDGIYNVGRNPLYISEKVQAPIYTIGIGDTSQVIDVQIKNTFHNKIAYLNDKFEIQVDIQAKDAQGASTTLLVSKVENDRVTTLERIPVRVDRNNFFEIKSVILDAEPSGVQRFRFSLIALSNEKNISNNTRDIFVDVLDARQKILILAHAPHPDLSALKQLATISQNNEVEIAVAESFDGNIRDFDFIILHQLPSTKYPIQNILQSIQIEKTPHLYVLGTQSDIGLFNRSQEIVEIQGAKLDANEVQAQLSPTFNLFIVSEEMKAHIKQFLPLYAPFGEYTVNPRSQVFMNQVIGNIETNYPLLVFDDQNGLKTGILMGEGIWRWKLFDYLQRKNFNVVNELVNKSLQYLSLREDRRKFRVNLSKNIFDENEPLLYNAELYNRSYQLVNEPDVFMDIVDQQGQEYNFIFNRFNDYYNLNAGLFSPGNYTFAARTNYDGDRLTFDGKFSIQPIELEYFETTAKHGLLRSISDDSGASFLLASQLDNLVSEIQNQTSIRPVLYHTLRNRSLINVKWIFVLFAFVMCLEWFLRRYFGAY